MSCTFLPSALEIKSKGGFKWDHAESCDMTHERLSPSLFDHVVLSDHVSN